MKGPYSWLKEKPVFSESVSMARALLGREIGLLIAEQKEIEERAATAGPIGFLAEMPNGVLPFLKDVLPDIYQPSER